MYFYFLVPRVLLIYVYTSVSSILLMVSTRIIKLDGPFGVSGEETESYGMTRHVKMEQMTHNRVPVPPI
jgi:hypothetical protein